MKLERKNFAAENDTKFNLSELERAMVASIALMKRLRRERRRSTRSDSNSASEE